MTDLDRYLAALPALRTGMLACKVGFFALSPLNAAPKIALGKWRVEDRAAGLGLVSADGTVRLVPTTTDPKVYAAGLLELSAKKRPVTLVPKPYAEFLGRTFKVVTVQSEYLFETGRMRTYPGGGLKQIRKDTNNARRALLVETLAVDRAADYLRLNAAWYREAAGRKFRTYDKTSIDWLLNNWTMLVEKVPDVVCLGIRDRATGTLHAFNMACRLVAGTWTAYTRRYDRTGHRGAGWLGLTELARRFEDPICNDGTADSKEIRAWKDKLGSPSVVACACAWERHR